MMSAIDFEIKRKRRFVRATLKPRIGVPAARHDLAVDFHRHALSRESERLQ